MHDKGKVITGIVIFFIVVLFPIWFSGAFGGGDEAPEFTDLGEGGCVEDAEYMRSSHMRLLNDWRNKVVRESVRTFVDATGREHEMSLSKTCLSSGCHGGRSKTEFCDKCHGYVGVTPSCWECHVVPGEE